MSAWFNYTATLKILIFSLLAGALLPGLFAVGVRLQAAGDGATPPRAGARCWLPSVGRSSRWCLR
ncbi:transmembrane protein [Mycobacterium tuberculosis]|nr:transmembrane protein [Mycobacterium tuberculosis]